MVPLTIGAHRPDRVAAPPIDDLFAGDPIQRVIVASALGREDVAFTSRVRLSFLLETMRDDRFPGVRSVAFASLRAIADHEIATTAFSPTAASRERRGQVERLARDLSVGVRPPERHASLRARASEREIEIGE